MHLEARDADHAAAFPSHEVVPEARLDPLDGKARTPKEVQNLAQVVRSRARESNHRRASCRFEKFPGLTPRVLDIPRRLIRHRLAKQTFDEGERHVDPC